MFLSSFGSNYIFLENYPFYLGVQVCWHKLFLIFVFIYLFGCIMILLWHVTDLLVVACEIFSCGLWDVAPDQDQTWITCTGSAES